MKILSFGLSEKVERILLYDCEQVTGSLLLVICLGLAVQLAELANHRVMDIHD